MTFQKTLKHRIRARMSKTGESYTTARLHLVGPSRRPEPAATPPDEKLSDAAMRRGTGRSWGEWFELLDAWGAKERRHPEIARWLVATHGVGGWWAQGITGGYERARGMRARHQMAGGFTVGANKTVDAPLTRLRAAFTDTRRRKAWLGDAPITPRPGRGGAAIRFNWTEDGSRFFVTFVERPNGRLTVNVTHEKLPDAKAAERMKAWWRAKLAELPQQLSSARRA